MDQTTVDLILGALLPLLIAVVKRFKAPDYINAAIAMVVYALAGILAVVVSGQPIDINNLVPTIAIFTGAGTVAYQLFWKNWGDPQISEATG